MKPGAASEFMAFAARRKALVRPAAPTDAASMILRHRPAADRMDPAPWLQAAAVLACFDLARLRAPGHDGPLPDLAQEALIAQSNPMQSPPGTRVLPLHQRRRMLAILGTRGAMAAVLAANAPLPDLPVQRAFDVLVEGGAAIRAALDGQDLTLLHGMAEALPWVEGILDDLPDRADVLAVAARLRLTKPLHDLVGTHFAGRQDVLQDMLRQATDPAAVAGVLFLYGPGGVGKSTVLAKFALDVTAAGDADMIVYLNFDRADLRVDEPLTVLREIVVQLAAQQRREDLAALAQGVEAYVQRFADQRGALENASDGGGGWQDMIATVAAAINGLPDTRPILILVDTFERAQRKGATLVHRFWRMMTTLGEAAPRLRFFAAGRVDAFGIFRNAIRLGGLGRPAVVQMLAEICGTAPSDAVVDEVMKLTGGKPLTVRLAGLVILQTGVSARSDPKVLTETLLLAQSEHVEAVLYNRLLAQISDPEIHSIARTGLLLRRITPGLIAQVLAPACNLSLKPGQEDDLFDRYAREVDLAEPGTADWGEPMLTHRADVRVDVLPALRDGDRAQLRAIDQSAIAFFAGKNGPMARAEEIYHRLWTDESPASIALRWTPGVAPYLADAMDEVGPAQQAWLANKLQIDIPEAVRAQADAASWEDFALRTATSYLNSGDVAAALQVLQERKGRLPGSPLFLLRADALSRAGRHAEMEAEIAAGLASAARAPGGGQRQTAELRLMRALTDERRRRFARAGADCAAAFRIAGGLGDSDLTLRAAVALLRLHRKVRDLDGPRPATLAAAAIRLLDAEGDASLLQRPALMRSLAAELGPLRPGLVRDAMRRSGHVMLATPQPPARAVILRALDDLMHPDFVQVRDAVERARAEGGKGRANALGELANVAEERGLMRAVAAPLARILAAETDQLLGSFPAPGLLHRRRSWWSDRA